MARERAPSETTDCSEEESEDGEEAQWTADHLKLLYLVSQYAAAAGAPGDAEGWIRKNQLIVLMYECIVGEGEASARAPPVVC